MTGAEHEVDAVERGAASQRRPLPPLQVAIPALIGAWALVLEIPRFVGMVRHDPAATDFRLYYVAAQVGRMWGWSDIYDPRRLHAASLVFGQADAVITPSYTLTSPPLLPLLIAPLTALPLSAAFYVWTAVNIAAFVTAWWMVSPGTGLGRVAVLLISLALWPTIFAIERGQPVPLVYALAMGSWWMASRRREVEAGILLALALTLKPQDVALLPAVLFLCGRVGLCRRRLLRPAAHGSIRSRRISTHRPSPARGSGAGRRVAAETVMEARFCHRARGHHGLGAAPA